MVGREADFGAVWDLLAVDINWLDWWNICRILMLFDE